MGKERGRVLSLAKYFQRIALILVLLTFSFAFSMFCHASGDSGFTEYNYPEDGFSVTLPHRWVEISQKPIDQLNEANGGNMPFK